MGGDGGMDNDVDSGALNRRRLLKGAAATGIGVAVWSTPSISAIGGTPVYAAMCTSGATSYELGSRNTNCNCDPLPGTPGAKTVRYKELGSACTAGPAFPGTAVMVQGACGGTPINDAGTCAPGYGTASGEIGNAGVCVTPTDQTLFCQTEVRIWQGGSCAQPFTQFFGAIKQGAAFLPLPGVPCQGGGNIFMSVFVRCSAEEECLS